MSPHFKAAIHAVDLGEILFDKVLGRALATVAMVTVDNKGFVGIRSLDKLLKALVVEVRGRRDVGGGKGLFVTNVRKLAIACRRHCVCILGGYMFEVRHEHYLNCKK